MCGPARSKFWVLLMVAFAALPATSAQAWFEFPYFVIDAAKLAERLQTVQEQAEQVEALRQQVENEARMLQSLDFSTLAGVTHGMRQIENLLHRAGGYGQPVRISEQYPLDWNGTSKEQARYDSQRDRWLLEQRSGMTHLRTLQNNVVLEMPAAESRVAELVRSSNAAAGVTSAVQARNQLQAELIAELQKLQALRMARARLRSEQQAMEQSEGTRAQRVVEWLYRDEALHPVSRGRGTYRVEPIAGTAPRQGSKP